MLYFSRWATAAILAIPLVLCLAAIPNFLPKQAFDSLPQWAQRKMTLGWDVQGGTRMQLQVDENDVRQQALVSLHGDVRAVLRQAGIGLISPPAIRDRSVELRIRKSDLQRAYVKLSELGPEIVVEPGGRLTRLRLTREAIRERVSMGREGSIDLVARLLRANGIESFSIQRQGLDRVIVEVPGLWNPYSMVTF